MNHLLPILIDRSYKLELKIRYINKIKEIILKSCDFGNLRLLWIFIDISTCSDIYYAIELCKDELLKESHHILRK